MTLDDLLTMYLETNPGIRSRNTERLFRTVAAHWSKWMGRVALVADFSDRNLVAYMRARRAAKKADATVDNEAVKLLVLWRFAFRQRLCDEPRIQIHRTAPNAPRALLRNEVRALFRAAARSKGVIAGHKVNSYYPALLGIIWNSAERISAVVSIERRDIDLKAATATFRVRKGRGKTLIKPLSWSTRRAVQRWLAESKGSLPFKIVAMSTVYYHLDQLLIDAGIPPERRNKFHALRRSHASYLKAAGGDAVESLGHDSEKTTRTFYYDPRITGARRAIDLLFHPLGFWREFASRVAGWFF